MAYVWTVKGALIGRFATIDTKATHEIVQGKQMVGMPINCLGCGHPLVDRPMIVETYPDPGAAEEIKDFLIARYCLQGETLELKELADVNVPAKKEETPPKDVKTKKKDKT